MHTIIRAWSVFCAFLPLQLARWHWLKGWLACAAPPPSTLQLARWHWLKVDDNARLRVGQELQLARQRYLLNSAILLFYPIFSIPNDFMFEFFL